MRGRTEVNIGFEGGGMMHLEIRLLDTAALVGYKDLASLGNFVGREECENIETMDIVPNENPTKFCNHAMIDFLIPLSYWLSIHNFTQSLGEREISLTVGGISAIDASNPFRNVED